MRAQLSYLLLLLAAVLHHTALAQEVVAPSQGGEVGLVLVTATTMELRFGTKGDGQGRVVAMAATTNTMPMPLYPSPNQFYTASSQFGQGSPLGKGYVVYNGADHSVTVTGLKPGTYYYVTDAEYNTNGTSIAYNTDGTTMTVATRPAAEATATAPLPVELTAFTGSVDGRSLATLRWATASEHNAAYFALERSGNGTAFAEVGRVAAAGHSSQNRAYQWPDKQPLSALTYYRLRQVDQDGTFSYSQVLTLLPAAGASVAQSLDVYPNPSAGSTIQLAVHGYLGESVQLHLTDAVGRTVLAQQLAPADGHYLTTLSLPPGIATGTYILTLAGPGSPIQKRIVVSN